MTPERAFWEAVGTVCIPTLVIWGVLLYVVRNYARPDEWPLYLIFVTLPLPLIFPIYKRYLKGKSALKQGTPRSHFIAAGVSAVLGVAYVAPTLLHHRDNSDLVIHLAMGIAWLAIGGDHLRRAEKVRRESRGATISL